MKNVLSFLIIMSFVLLTNSCKTQEMQVYSVVDTMPSFPGGNSQLMTFISSNFHYPEKTMESGIQGRLVSSFIVEKDGSISHVQIVRKVEPHLDNEFIRVLKAMPRWIPGKQHGKEVRVHYTIPLNVDPQ